MSILVLVEHDNQNVKSATLNTITAAQKIGGRVEAIVIGCENESVASEVSQLVGIEKVLLVNDNSHKHQLAESVSECLFSLKSNYEYILAPATTFGKNILPRLSALADCSQLSDIIEVTDDKTFLRPIYAGNAQAIVETTEALKIISIRPTAFPAAEVGEVKAPIEAYQHTSTQQLSSFISREQAHSDRPELTTANIVISGGRGLQSKENFSLLSEIADLLNAAIGASRAAVDAGFIGNDHQVGQTGKMVAPDLYIAIGISGAIQHLAGMKDSKCIVAINNDKDAPIFSFADYGLHADLFTALPELASTLKTSQ